MLQHSGRRFRLYPHKAKFTDRHGQQKEKWALPSKEWWESTASKHGFEVEFEEIELSEEQQARYELIRQMDVPESFRTDAIDFILEGTLPERLSHPLWQLKADVSIEDMKPIDLTVDKQEIKTDGEDTATITGKVPEHIERAYVLVNAPPPVHEVVNDGEIEIEFTTEDAGYHVIEVTAGNHRGLTVVKGVKE